MISVSISRKMSHQSNYISFLLDTAVNESSVRGDNAGPGYNNTSQAREVDKVGKSQDFTLAGFCFTDCKTAHPECMMQLLYGLQR